MDGGKFLRSGKIAFFASSSLPTFPLVVISLEMPSRCLLVGSFLSFSLLEEEERKAFSPPSIPLLYVRCFKWKKHRRKRERERERRKRKKKEKERTIFFFVPAVQFCQWKKVSRPSFSFSFAFCCTYYLLRLQSGTQLVRSVRSLEKLLQAGGTKVLPSSFILSLSLSFSLFLSLSFFHSFLSFSLFLSFFLSFFLDKKLLFSVLS